MASNDNPQPAKQPSVPYQDDDTIDLGALLRGLFAQWVLIGCITLGAVATAGIIILTLPNKYRVEATFTQPTLQAVQPLLEQSIKAIELDDISREFVDNLKSYSLMMAAYNAALENKDDQLADAARVSTVQSLQRSLTITPANPEALKDDSLPLETVTVSFLSADPQTAQVVLNELMVLAAQRTAEHFKADIEATRDIRIARLQAQITQVELAAENTLQQRVNELEQAINLANTLDIVEPTDWTALVHGSGNVQLITQGNGYSENDLFLQGTRILSAQLEALRQDGAARQFTGSFNETEVIDLSSLNKITTMPEGNIFVTTPPVTKRSVNHSELVGEMASLQNIQIPLDNVALIDQDSLARVPASPASPKRLLIATAALVLGGFLGVFVALIRLAIRDND
ncbi:Wzz/FepE/Etk N-terminal domain-containing protein [Saccharospirillum sp. HFRX-1]|uniref:LPS O-antigen chain length determinant protein WzzB n=1 Tax=unclassified Saccharospirillum TaxID=2633430 RepID=UPI00370FB73F